MKVVTFALALAVCSVTPAIAQEKASSPPWPAGWQGRADGDADIAKTKFFVAGGGFHVTSGPAAIFWEPVQRTGDYRISATFTQTKAPTHPEAYGLFIGGKNLDKPNQEYGYLVIRGDGKYLIKHRAGNEVHMIVDWTDSPALKKQDANGQATNTVAFEVKGDFVTALINGTEVKRWEKKYWPGEGLAGLRVNHGLDIHIEPYAVTPIK